MRTNFYDLLAQRKFDVSKEYIALWHLFCEERSIFNGYSSRPLADIINDSYFRELPFRGSFVSLFEMMSALGFQRQSAITIDKLFTFCELLIAVLHQKYTNIYRDIPKQRKAIIDNIEYILERTNHEFKQNSDQNWIIVEKNKPATMAAQLVTDTTVAFDLIEYNHFAIKGHLTEKKKILTSIASYIEPILKSKVLSNAGYKQLESDTGFVFNNFHIRHNNKEGAKANDYIASISNKDLEDWYDKAYELALSVIIINDYLSIGKDIADIKPKYTWRT